MLRLHKNVYNRLIEHAKKDAPIEACGYLVEKSDVITSLYPLKNIDESVEHFSLDPKEQFEVVRAIRSEGSKLVAVYHSHSASPASPSQEDIRLAFDPHLSYVIVSLMNQEPTIKSSRICKGNVEEENVEIIE